MEREQCLRLLKQSFLLQGTDEEAAAKLLESEWRILSFNKGELIFGGGISEDSLGMLLSGRAIAYSGASAILRGFAKGDVFGAAALFTPSAEAAVRVVAQSAGEALLLPLPALRQLMSEDWRVAENYIRFLAQRIVFLNRKIAAFTAGEAKNRLAAHIAANCRRDELGRWVFSGNISKLAPALDISRASFYRALHSLTEQGAIRREGNTIVIDDLLKLSK